MYVEVIMTNETIWLFAKQYQHSSNDEVMICHVICVLSAQNIHHRIIINQYVL